MLASNLRQNFLNYINVSKQNFSKKKFRILISTFIENLEINSFDIQRKYLKNKTAYNRIKLKK